MALLVEVQAHHINTSDSYKANAKQSQHSTQADSFQQENDCKEESCPDPKRVKNHQHLLLKVLAK